MLTVLIIAHEEEEKLSRNLPILLSQQGTEYEVVVVDMNSEDNTIEMLKSLETTNKHLRHILLPQSAKDISRERLAVHLGLRTANTTRVLITRAGIEIDNQKWLYEIEKRWRTDSDIILIPTKRKRDKSFNNFFSLKHETWRKKMDFKHANKYNLFRATSNILGLNKDRFLKHNSPFEHLALKTGTLDIFISHVATQYNTTLIREEELFPLEEQFNTPHQWAQMRLFDVETRKHLPEQFKRRLAYLWYCLCSIHRGSIIYSMIDAYDYLRWKLTRRKTFIKKRY